MESAKRFRLGRKSPKLTIFTPSGSLGQLVSAGTGAGLELRTFIFNMMLKEPKDHSTKIT